MSFTDRVRSAIEGFAGGADRERARSRELGSSGGSTGGGQIARAICELVEIREVDLCPYFRPCGRSSINTARSKR